jgi:hypothetical protein
MDRIIIVGNYYNFARQNSGMVSLFKSNLFLFLVPAISYFIVGLVILEKKVFSLGKKRDIFDDL